MNSRSHLQPDPASHSITLFIDGLREGEETSTQKIWERFYGRLIRLASKKLAGNRKAIDEDDIVQEAFEQFFRQVKKGRFPQLKDRYDLWRTLAMLVDRRAKDQYRRAHAQKRGGGNVYTESIFIQWEDAAGIGGVPCPEPTGELVIQLSEIFRDRMNKLDNDTYRKLALMKMQGFSNLEIAELTGDALRTIERRLNRIRKAWSAGKD